MIGFLYGDLTVTLGIVHIFHGFTYTPEVALFATPPFRNTAPFSQHFFNEFVFCLGTPFRNTSLDQKDFRPEN